MECVPNQEAVSETFCFLLEGFLLPESGQKLDELIESSACVGPFRCGFRTTNESHFGKDKHTNLCMDEPFALRDVRCPWILHKVKW
jgi:hypothetical protein